MPTTDELLSGLSEAERAAAPARTVPGWVEPALAVLTEDRFDDPDWIYERKLDGERVLAFRKNGEVSLRTRNRRDVSSTWPEIREALQAEGGPNLVLDGEVVTFDGKRTSFSRLQRRIGLRDAERARATGIRVSYYAFDLLHFGDRDLRPLPLRARKGALRRALRFEEPLRYTSHRNEHGSGWLKEACGKGWEGLIAKDARAAYPKGRSKAWLKFKCSVGQELVIGGWTDPKGGREGFGALVVGYHEAGELRPAGKVGTGFDTELLRTLSRKLRRLGRSDCPFRPEPYEDAHWVDPRLVAEVRFTEWTRDGKLRHPRFVGLREDKDAGDVVRERPEGTAT